MRGVKPTTQQLAYMELLFTNQYPLQIIADRTGMSTRTIERYAKDEGWNRTAFPKMDVDETLRDFQATTAHLGTRILYKATHGEYDDEYQTLASTSRQMTFVTESLMKQAAYHPAKQAETFLKIARTLIKNASQYTDEQKALIEHALLTIHDDVVTNVINTLEKLTL